MNVNSMDYPYDSQDNGMSSSTWQHTIGLAPRGSITVPSNAAAGSKRKRIACRGCRQAKLRCEAPSQGSGPCSRCRRLGRDCRTDAGFKRVHRGVTFDQLAEQVERLRSVVTANGSSGGTQISSVEGQSLSQLHGEVTTPGIASRYSPNNGLDEGSGPNSSYGLMDHCNTEGSPMAEFNELQYSLSTTQSRAVDEVELSGDQLTELFRIFFQQYHPYLPILDTSISPDEYYSRSKPLFWVIVSIAARRYEQDLTLLASLAQPCTQLIWSSISVRRFNRFLIKAILFICNWPFPCTSMWDDPSYVLLSTAKAAAVQFGLHRPEIITDFRRKRTTLDTKAFLDATKAWTGLYIVAQSAITWAGHPSLFASDYTVDQAASLGTSYTLPHPIRHTLLIQKFSNHVSQTMSENKHSQTGLPSKIDSSILLNVLERDYEELERILGDQVSSFNKILLGSARLQFQVCYFFEPSSSDSRRRGLLKAYSTALSLIHTVDFLDEKKKFSKYGPTHVQSVLPIAAIVLMKTLHSSYAQFIDMEAGRTGFNRCLHLIREASIENNDVTGRCMKILSQLWNLHSEIYAQKDQEPNVHLRSRSSASILHDALWMWREKFNRQASGFSEPASNVASPTPLDDIPINDIPGLDQPMEFDLSDMDSIWDNGLSPLLFIDLDNSSFDLSL